MLALPVLTSGCSQSEVDKFVTEMGQVAASLDAIDASAAQGNWQQAKDSLEQAKLHHSKIDAGIDDLQKRGVDQTQIERGRAASTCLHDAVNIIDNMLVWHMTLPTLNMEGLSKGTKDDVARAVSTLNQLITIAENTKTSIDGFLNYAGTYNNKYPDDAKKMRVNTAIPKMEQLRNDLMTRQSEFRSIIKNLIGSPPP
jgi:hypothetical protein